MVLEAVLVGAKLGGLEGPVLYLDDPRLDFRLELRAPVIRAAVVVKVETLYTLEAVERHPFRQIASLVPKDGTDRKGNRGARAERGRPALPAVARPASPIPDPAGAGKQGSGRDAFAALRHRAAGDAVLVPPARIESISLSRGMN